MRRAGRRRQEVADSISPSSAPAAETAEPTIAPKTTPSKRAKRANAQAERTGTAHRGPNQASPDALPSLDLLDALQPSDIGGSLSPDGGLPDIFAGLNEAEAGIQGLSDDLSDIDGGGLPSTAAEDSSEVKTLTLLHSPRSTDRPPLPHHQH